MFRLYLEHDIIKGIIMGNGIRFAADQLSNAKYEFGLMIKQ